ncbi:hypothetical protein, variant [Sphaeroforma arctica JP610]|uniref:MYND-type domain-containing protein n=1 Tax=Sphaeroforma arctica JP610 TaxID=667725 RepID=A0A0L0GFJ9_9EUKA|nr:hypothetical protein, variant [Sphaeroforma arctica JP610]KNC87053.1 hypothetical protein, variant [Sphaeroforma arctica JP610]|eukprot:XP_014160956.1 hypothetical protein, variant [Sphaeroforma arctica JP610]
MSSNWEVSTTSHKGRYIRAKLPLTRGTLVLKSDPFAYTVTNKQKALRCSACLKASEGLRGCGRCKKLYFCNSQCQRRAWPRHKQECKAICASQKVALDAMSIVCHAVWRAAADKKTLFDSDFGVLQSNRRLQSTDDDVAQAPTAMLIRTYLESSGIEASQIPSIGDAMNALSVIKTNSFTILDDEMMECGVGIYPLASNFNHSCDPNVVITFNGFELQARLIRNVHTGDEMTISYIDNAKPREERRNQLRKQYYFNCDCSLCGDTQMDDTHLAFRCQQRVGGNQCDAMVPFDDGKQLVGDDALCSQGHVQSITGDRMNSTAQHLDDKITEAKSVSESDRAIQMCDEVMCTGRKILFKYNTQLTAISSATCDIAINHGRFDKAYDYGMDGTRGLYRILSDGFDPRLGIQEKGRGICERGG